jgi:hypothetical protein
MVQFQDEKRTSERFSYSKTVTYKALGIAGSPPEKVPVQVKSVNVSSGGMRIRMNKRLLTEGSIIQMNLPVPQLNISIPVLTEVKWIKEKKLNLYYIGLQFLLH